MATSGRIQSGSNNSSYFYFQWQLAGQDIGSNTSTINWQWGLNTAGGAYWQTNAVKSVSGNINGGGAFGGNTWSNIGGPYSGNGDHQLLAGSWGIGHNGDGTKNFGMSSTGNLYQGGNFSNSGSWDLPTIPRHSVLTGISTDAGGIPFTDEGPAWVEFNNPAGTGTQGFIDVIGYGRAVTSGNVGSRYNFDFSGSLPGIIQAASPNSNTYSINIGIQDELGGTNYDYRVRDGSIANGSGQANPVFTTFTYKDNLSASVTVTGNNQLIVQGVSDLLVTVPVANKAVPQKSATMDHYNVAIGGFTNTTAYSASSDVTEDVDLVSDVTGSTPLTVTAVDSRGNVQAVSQNVTVLPYAPPDPNCTATRANGFDDALILHFDGSVSPLTVSGTDKNVINTTTGVQYRVAEDNTDITTVGWTNVTNSQASGTGVITASDIILAASGDASSRHSFKVQVKFQDHFYTTTETMNVASGTPILRIGLDKFLYYLETEFHDEFSDTANKLYAGMQCTPGVGTWVQSVVTGTVYPNGCLFNTSLAQNDYVTMRIYLTEGIYNWSTSWFATTNAGISEIFITGVSQGTIDNYAASGTENIINYSGFHFQDNGYYDFMFKVTGKNASSTGYGQRLMGIKFTRTDT